MKNTKIRRKPTTRKGRSLAKKRVAKAIKVMLRKSHAPKTIPQEDADFIAAIKRPSGLRDYDPDNSRFNGVHPESNSLHKFQWLGLLTLKFHAHSYSKDDREGQGRKNRLNFLAAFMENLRVKFRITDREFIWVGCEEFGFTGGGHLHVMFSFDQLTEKGRADKIPKIDFAENGQFFREGQESADFVCRNLGIKPKSVDFHWCPVWENEGLVNYFGKIEFRRPTKHFESSNQLKKHGLLKAA
jgi:hypothetical protein